MALYQEQSLRLYNSMSGEKEIFTPINEGNVGMYVCGPTVYSNVHLGNCRTFISFDLVFRYLKHLGYKVRYVRNITDAGHMVAGDRNDIFANAVIEFLARTVPVDGEPVKPAHATAPHHEGPPGDINDIP